MQRYQCGPAVPHSTYIMQSGQLMNLSSLYSLKSQEKPGEIVHSIFMGGQIALIKNELITQDIQISFPLPGLPPLAFSVSVIKQR